MDAMAPPVAQLEAAFQTVVDKLRVFYRSLPSDEQSTMMELLKSAQSHSDHIQAGNEGDPDKIIYDKPIQVHSTSAMKQKMKDLPRLFEE